MPLEYMSNTQGMVSHSKTFLSSARFFLALTEKQSVEKENSSVESILFLQELCRFTTDFRYLWKGKGRAGNRKGGSR